MSTKGRQMSKLIIADLVVLGICQKSPTSPEGLIQIAKSLIPDLWQPTGGVLLSAIQRNLTASYLDFIDTELLSNVLKLTPAGSEQVRTLLLADPGNETTSTTLTADAIQFFFLDNADAETADQVLKRLRLKVGRRISEFKKRSNKYPSQGRFTGMWANMEKCRLEGMAQMLENVSMYRSQVILDFQEAAE